MSEGLLVSPDQSTGDVNVNQETQTSVMQDQGSVDTQAQNTQTALGTVNDLPGLIARAERAEAEARRLSEYNEFLKKVPQSQQPQREKFSIDPDAIPYASDVDKIVEQRLEERFAREQEQRLVVDLQTTAEQRRASDPDFDRRMSLAREYIERDDLVAAMFMRETTAAGKIAMMEKIATWHPNFGGVAARQSLTPSPAAEAMQKLKESAATPPVLSQISGASIAQRPVSQMSSEEYREYFKQITKGY